MAKSIRNGILSYGLVNVPVGVVVSAKSKDFEFRTLHKECGTPIAQVTQCPVCQADNLGPDDLTKGYEFVKKQYVVLDPEELKSIGSERSPIIRINKFVAWDEMDELQVDKSYLLAPNAMMTTPYTLLSNAMGEKQVVGVGTQSLWGKEHPMMVWAKEGGTLVLSNLFCWDEISSDEEIQSLIGLVSEEEQELANQFVALNIRQLDLKEDLVSESRRRMDKYVEAKLNGLTVEIAPPEELPQATTDIQAQLKASIAQAREAA